MVVSEIKTPIGIFSVYRNNEKEKFIVEDKKDECIWLEDKKFYATGCYTVLIDLSHYSIGDVIRCEIDNGELVDDGGGEHILNIVGEVDDYIIGIAAPDTEDIEDSYRSDIWPEDMNVTKYEIPYELDEIESNGFIYRIKDNTEEYQDRKFRKYIEMTLAWKEKDSVYAWEIVSCLTS